MFCIKLLFVDIESSNGIYGIQMFETSPHENWTGPVLPENGQERKETGSSLEIAIIASSKLGISAV